ncbi:MAG: G8 domain-containing protein [Planctomycetota bacterium]
MNRMVCGVVALVLGGSVGASSSPVLFSSLGLAPGSDWTIAAGASVVFDVPSATLGEVIVQGELIFDDAIDVRFEASRIMVMGSQGAIRAGSVQDPFEGELTIVLTEPIGAPEDQPMMGYRVLGVMNGGSLELHGETAGIVSWTQLAADAVPGATELTLIEPSGWSVGDAIALAPSGEDAREMERLTVTSVSADGRTIGVEPPLAYTHLGRVFTYAGKDIDMRAEVGLLSRNIRIVNPENEVKPTGEPLDKLGFHAMFMPTSGPITLSGVELVGGGQIARPGRYPIHWHRDESLDVQYGNRGWQVEAPSRAGDAIENCSIHSSGQRGIVVHGVNDVRVERNVVADVWDTAYIFSEDGIEKGNVFRGNLAMLVKRKSRSGDGVTTGSEFAFPRDDHTESNQAEHRPAGFWGRNPFNPLINNHSAGTVEGIGFFIDSQVMSYDMSRLIQREQSQTETVVFTGNVSHSNYRAGVAGGGIPTYGPKTRGHGLMVGDYNASFDAVFEDFQTYQNSVLGVWIEDDRHTLRDAILTDSSGGLIAFRSTLEDVVFNQRSDNTLGRAPQLLGNRKNPAGGIHVQPTGYGNHANLSNVTFMNVEPAAVSLWSDPLPAGSGMTLEGITLVNTMPVYHGADPDELDSTYVDLDGSLTGTGRRTVIGGAPLLDQGGVFDAAANAVFLVEQPPLACRADLNGNGVVDSADFVAVLVNFGLPADAGAGDLDGDGTVDDDDFIAMVVAFGGVCEE